MSVRVKLCAGLIALALGLVGGRAGRLERVWDPGDPLLHGDPVDPATGQAAEIVPGAPWIRRTAKGWRAYPRVVGDVDLVVRTGRPDLHHGMPPPNARGPGALARGTAEPFGEGTPVVVSVIPSDGGEPRPYGTPAAPPDWEGLPVLLSAFADLDGDGYVGVTSRDGDRRDDEIERAEWTPAGLAWAFGRDGTATGELVVGVGGPAGAPARVALVAATYAGPIEPDYRDGVFPHGPAVMSALPFLPVTAPDELLHALPRVPVPPEPGSRVAVNVQVAYAPGRRGRPLREAFALPVDGSEPSIDAAEIRSGRVVRVGIAQRPDPDRYRALPSRPLRPGLDADGQLVPFEVLARLALPDDGGAGRSELVLVGLDRLGNLGDPETAMDVRVETSGVVRIVEPDRDGDPFAETVQVTDARGTRIVLDDAGGAFDDANADVVRIETAAGITRLDVALADPDVDDSGQVTWRDLFRVSASAGAELGTARFDPALDQDGSGVIDLDDLRRVAAHLWQSMPVP